MPDIKNLNAHDLHNANFLIFFSPSYRKRTEHEKFQYLLIFNVSNAEVRRGICR